MTSDNTLKAFREHIEIDTINTLKAFREYIVAEGSGRLLNEYDILIKSKENLLNDKPDPYSWITFPVAIIFFVIPWGYGLYKIFA